MRFQETETVELKSIVMDDIKKEIACPMPQFNKKAVLPRTYGVIELLFRIS